MCDEPIKKGPWPRPVRGLFEFSMPDNHIPCHPDDFESWIPHSMASMPDGRFHFMYWARDLYRIFTGKYSYSKAQCRFSIELGFPRDYVDSLFEYFRKHADESPEAARRRKVVEQQKADESAARLGRQMAEDHEIEMAVYGARKTAAFADGTGWVVPDPRGRSRSTE